MPADVKDVVLTHMHYDHVGNFHQFPIARFHLQEPEIHYAVGRYMRHRQLAKSFEPDDVCGVVRLNFDGRVVYRTGPGEVVPGISVVPTGGHSAGLQFVKVNTRRGIVVLASDVTHFYENMETGRPFTTAFHVGEMLDAYDTLRAHAPSPQHIVPGHDPEVMRNCSRPAEWPSWGCVPVGPAEEWRVAQSSISGPAGCDLDRQRCRCMQLLCIARRLQ